MAHNILATRAAFAAVIAFVGSSGEQREAAQTSVESAEDNYNVDFVYGSASSGHGTSWRLTFYGQDWRAMLNETEQEMKASLRQASMVAADNGGERYNALVHSKVTQQIQEALSRVRLGMCKPEFTHVAQLSDGGRAFAGWCDVRVNSQGTVTPESAGVLTGS
jgi:hypothetical protein